MDDPHPVLPMKLLLKILLNKCKKGDRTRNHKDVIKETVLKLDFIMDYIFWKIQHILCWSSLKSKSMMHSCGVWLVLDTPKGQQKDKLIIQ